MHATFNIVVLTIQPISHKRQFSKTYLRITQCRDDKCN